MGLFDLFGKEPENSTRRVHAERENSIDKNRFSYQSEQEKKDAPISVFSPTSFSQVEGIIDVLKTGKNAIVHLNQLKPDTAIRILDMLSGAIYAIGGGVYEMEKNIFMFAPGGVETN